MGDTFQRSHYHVLFFGLDFKDMQKFFCNSWKNGSIKSLPITQGGIRYVVDYMSKNINGDMAIQEYDNLNRERPFKTSSRGLGSEFFYAHREEINDTGCIKMGSRFVPIPTYYKNILRYINEDSLEVYEKQKLLSYRNIMNQAKELGFNDYDTYIRYKRKNIELSLYKKMQSKGIPCLPSYNDYESYFDGYVSKKMEVFETC